MTYKALCKYKKVKGNYFSSLILPDITEIIDCYTPEDYAVQVAPPAGYLTSIGCRNVSVAPEDIYFKYNLLYKYKLVVFLYYYNLFIIYVFVGRLGTRYYLLSNICTCLYSLRACAAPPGFASGRRWRQYCVICLTIFYFKVGQITRLACLVIKA